MRRLLVREIGRTTAEGERESLTFEPGVNVIVGPQNTGKSTWLRMLDYLMGETESPAERFDEVLVSKYRSISATLLLGDETAVLERSWTEGGRRSQMTLNGERFSVAETQSFFLQRLGIPVLRYPQGNVHASERTWPSLGWRSLLRHIYRRQEFWGELVPQQPESEQHASLLQFLALAEHLFPAELATLVDTQKQIARLQNRKDYFVEVMQQIAPDLVGDQNVSVGITPQSIDAAMTSVRHEIDQLVETRSALLASVRDRTAPPDGALGRLLEARVTTLRRRDELKERLGEIEGRARELVRYRSNLAQELDRLGRADAAAAVFEDIKVTHCPACDQSVQDRARTHDRCFLCGQATPDASEDAAGRRLQFERNQITAELAEADELVQAAQAEADQTAAAFDAADREVRELEATLRPFQASASGIVPEEIALTDQKIGALNARLQALQRLYGPLEIRDKLSAQIEALQVEQRRLEATVSQKDDLPPQRWTRVTAYAAAANRSFCIGVT
jgi:chromosome segregation ATPase